MAYPVDPRFRSVVQGQEQKGAPNLPPAPTEQKGATQPAPPPQQVAQQQRVQQFWRGPSAHPAAPAIAASQPASQVVAPPAPAPQFPQPPSVQGAPKRAPVGGRKPE